MMRLLVRHELDNCVMIHCLACQWLIIRGFASHAAMEKIYLVRR